MSSDRPKNAPLVCVACPGAGIAGRGYESFAIELAGQLQDRGEFRTLLLTGGKVTEPWTKRVPTLPRLGRTVRLAAKIIGRPPTFIEQMTFGVASLPILFRLRPRTILFSERLLGSLYDRVRSANFGERFGFQPRLVFSNGGGWPPPYPKCDVVQHVTPVTYRAAIQAGESPERHVLLPYGFEVPDFLTSLKEESIRRPTVISVGLLDIKRKRMDHIIREVAHMETPAHLILLGQESVETPSLRALANDLLGEANVEVLSVRPDQVGSFYQRSDVFALASIDEAFGRVYIEAMLHGLPCVAHDFPVSRYVLGSNGIFIDMTSPGKLARVLDHVLRSPDPIGPEARRNDAVARFSWNTIIPGYIDLFQQGT